MTKIRQIDFKLNKLRSIKIQNVHTVIEQRSVKEMTKKR